MKTRASRPLLVVVAVLGLIFVVGFLARGFLLEKAIGLGGRALGYNVRYGALEQRGGHLTVLLPDVSSLAHEPVFTAARIDIAYDLRQAFGGPRLFGISALEIDRPKITLVHHPDGSWNVNFPKSNPATPAKPLRLPQLRLVVKDGSFGLIDDTRLFQHSRRLALQNIQLRAAIEPRTRSNFTAQLALLEEGGQFPISGRGTFDETRGYELARIRAPEIALAPLLDYALNSTSLHVANGVLNDVEARIYGLPDRRGVMERHLSVSANLAHFQPYLNGLTKPLRDGRGSIRVYDDGLAIPRVDGSIAGIPVRISGGIYSLAKPMLRLGIAGRGDLNRLVTLNDAAKNLPLAGPIAFTLLVEGDASQPTTLAAFDSSGIRYARLPIDGPRALVALSGPDTSIVRSSLSYDGIAAAARGNLHVANKHTGVELLASVDVPVARLPYAASLLGPMRVRASALVAGVDSKVRTTGALAGASAGRQLSGTFDVDASGVGTVGPLFLQGPGNRALYARLALDRPRGGGGAAFIQARAFQLSTLGAQPALPGVDLPRVPEFEGTLDTALAGAFERKHSLAAGNFHLFAARALGYPIDDFSGRAEIRDGTKLAAEGRYRGDLAALSRAAGGKIALRGRADVPLSVVADGTASALVQIHDARFTAANVGPVALNGLEATVGVRGRAFDVYAARVRLGPSDIVAQGSFGNGGSLQLSTGSIDLGALRGFGVPVGGGNAIAVAALGGTLAAPLVEAGVAADGLTLPDARYAGLTVSASTGLHYAADRLTLHDAVVRGGPAVGSLDGSVLGLRANPTTARYNFEARVRQADIATLARIARAPLRYPEGTLDAEVRVAGQGSTPSLRGSIAIPEGSLNGLHFRDAAVAFSGTAGGITARDGHVTVGSSTLHLEGSATRSAQQLALRAPALELSDFDDYFDRGDMLGGSGNLALTVANEPNALVTSGRLSFTHTRVRRFDVGDTRAEWTTSGRVVHTDIAVGSTAGRVTARGTLTLAATAPLQHALERTSVALQGRASNVDLGTWLPLAGLQIPLGGLVNATATVRGAYPNVVVQANADLQKGLVQRIPIRAATLELRAADGRATLTSATLALDGLRAQGSGTIGLRPGAALNVTLAAQTPDIGALAMTLTGVKSDASGTLQTTVHLTGNPQHLLASDALDAQNVRYERFVLPRMHAQFTLSPNRAVLQQAEFDLRAGRLLADGFAPFVTAPAFSVGPPNAPLKLDLTAEHVELAQFADLLPKGTQLGGSLDGRVQLAGSLANPGIDGTLALSDGSFVGPQEKSKISKAAAQLTFRDRTLTIADTTATVGGGALSVTGRVAVPDLQDPLRYAAVNLEVNSNGAVFDLPQYFRGRVNGTLSVIRRRNTSPVVGGNLTLSSARIPTSALLQSNASSSMSPAKLPEVAFDLAVTAGSDVRVQGGPVDIGAQGNLRVGGTLARPTASGELDSTGGTISFYRTFRLQYPSTLTFDPSDGVIPYVDATATTMVDNPPTDVTLHVTGQTTQLNVALASDPNYSREQILGLLVGAQTLGAVSGVQTVSGGPQQNPFQALAEGQLGTLLTQNVLEPFSSQLGSAVGLNNLSLNYTPGGGASIGAQKRIFKNLNVVFADSFNYPPRQSVGLILSPNVATALQLTFFSQTAGNQFDVYQGIQSLQSTNDSVTSAQPSNGTSGVSFSFQKKFW